MRTAEDLPECGRCGGAGWYVVTVPAHDPRCDGSCSVGCPVPVEAQEQCRECCGTGKELEALEGGKDGSA